MEFEYADASQQWFKAVLKDHQEEARSRVFALIKAGVNTETGCIETPTAGPRKVRVMGRQMPVYCILKGVMAG